MADKSTTEIGAQFINRFYGKLSSSAAVDLAVTTLSLPEKNKLNPEARTFKIIEMLEKVEELAFEKDITEDERKARGERLDQIVSAFIEESIIKKEDVPDNHFQNQLRLLRERGHGDLEISDDIKKQEIESIKNEQRASLINWTDYLLSDDARSAYPETWFRFYVLKNISELKSVDKQKATYPKRDKNYVGVFPELNQEVLSNLYKHVKKVAEIQFEEKSIAGLKKDEVIERRRVLEDAKRELDDFGQLAYQGRFGQLYYNLADRQREQQLTALKERGMSGTEGEWKTFAQRSGADELVKSLEGRGTGWCIAGEETALNYLKQGNIYIYFTKDSDDKLSLPRVAVRMENGSVAEVRGVNSDQNLEPEFIDIAKEKYEKLPGGDKYGKKVNDMEKLTEIDKKVRGNFDLAKDEVKFLYESGNEIEGFGHKKDPRIDNIRTDLYSDLYKNIASSFDCGENQIAEVLNGIKPDTKVFVGTLKPGVFDKLAKYHIENIYTVFPSQRVRIKDIEIGKKVIQDLQEKVSRNQYYVYPDAKNLISKINFDKINMDLKEKVVILSAWDLGFESQKPTIDRICDRAVALGLEVIHPEIGLILRQQMEQQKHGELVTVGMKPVGTGEYDEKVLFLSNNNNGLCINTWPADMLFDPDDVFIFMLPNSL